MPHFSFSCATRIAAKRARTAAQQHSSTAALPHGLTASRPHCRTASRRHGRTSAWRHGGTAHHRMAAAHGGTRWRRQSVHTPPLSHAHRAGSASMVRTARSLRTPAAGPHRGPLLQLSLLRRSLRGEVRRGRGRRSQHGPRGPWGHRIAVLRRQWIDWDYSRAHSPMCPRSRGEIARSCRAERLAQVAHCPRGNALPGEIALSARRGSRSGSAQAGQPRPLPWRADLLFQALDEESKLPCAFDYELHPPAYPCKGGRHVLM